MVGKTCVIGLLVLIGLINHIYCGRCDFKELKSKRRSVDFAADSTVTCEDSSCPEGSKEYPSGNSYCVDKKVPKSAVCDKVCCECDLSQDDKCAGHMDTSRIVEHSDNIFD
ncbi:uncharacterized protein LOC141907594 [Tubulanus polymorphus]|uniref:uncharacterized protein LOC141907594 n=1 Tax=Tubulanus polymorphus TaxID=672921 RepID=UPI003DA599BE